MVYHERQERQLCLLHALNNLLGHRAFSKTRLDSICEGLAPGGLGNSSGWGPNPHRSMLGIGNYDANVLMSALQQVECDATWWDMRRGPEQLPLLRPDLVGLILNVPNRASFWSSPWRLLSARKHWIAVRPVRIERKDSNQLRIWWNVDSKLETPFRIGTDPDLVEWLSEQIEKESATQIFVVSKPDPICGENGKLGEHNGLSQQRAPSTNGHQASPPCDSSQESNSNHSYSPS